MNALMKILGVPFGWLMWALYQFVNNYGLALILFTLIVKIILFPLGLKQQKSSVKMQLINPKMKEIQAKYKNNPQKMNEELSALYAKENYSPMSGCWPTVIQLLVVFGLLDVVYRPLTHLLRLSNDAVKGLESVASGLGVNLTSYAPQINIYQSIMQNPSAYSSISSETMNQIRSLDLQFLGMDLGVTPNLPWNGGFNWLILIPILSGLTAFLTSVISMKANPAMKSQGAGMKGMMYTMPLISLWITFMVPAGVGIYWMFSNVLGCIQQLILNKVYNPKEVAERMVTEEKLRAEKERQEKIEAKKQAKEAIKNGEEVEDMSMLSEKDRIKEARRRYAEKYGDKYEE